MAEELTSITYKLLPGVLWADGTPLLADDFVFTWQYCSAVVSDLCTDSFGAVQSVEALDALTLKVTFALSQAYPYTMRGKSGVGLRVLYQTSMNSYARRRNGWSPDGGERSVWQLS